MKYLCREDTYFFIQEDDMYMYAKEHGKLPTICYYETASSDYLRKVTPEESKEIWSRYKVESITELNLSVVDDCLEAMQDKINQLIKAVDNINEKLILDTK